MEFNLFFKFFARLGVTFFLIVLKISVSEEAVSTGIPRIKLDRLAKFSDRLLWDLGYQVGPAKQHVQRRRLPHRGLKSTEPCRSLVQLPRLQVGNSKKIAGFKIV